MRVFSGFTGRRFWSGRTSDVSLKFHCLPEHTFPLSRLHVFFYAFGSDLPVVKGHAFRHQQVSIIFQESSNRITQVPNHQVVVFVNGAEVSGAIVSSAVSDSILYGHSNAVEYPGAQISVSHGRDD